MRLNWTNFLSPFFPLTSSAALTAETGLLHQSLDSLLIFASAFGLQELLAARGTTLLGTTPLSGKGQSRSHFSGEQHDVSQVLQVSSSN